MKLLATLFSFSDLQCYSVIHDLDKVKVELVKCKWLGSKYIEYEEPIKKYEYDYYEDEVGKVRLGSYDEGTYIQIFNIIEDTEDIDKVVVKQKKKLIQKLTSIPNKIKLDKNKIYKGK